MPKFFMSFMTSTSASARKHTAPPSMVLKTFVAWNENMDASPKLAEDTPLYLTPKACAAS